MLYVTPKAIDLNPDCAEAYHNRGIAYQQLGKSQEAIRDYKKGCELGDNGACERSKNYSNLDNLAKTEEENKTSTLRIFQPGDSINYRVTGFVNQGGGDLPLFGTAQFLVTDKTQVDYYGNRCNIFRVTMAFTIMEKDRSLKINRVIDRFVTQDANGSLMVHGEKDSEMEVPKFVKAPLSGWYYEFKSPINLHDSVSQNAIFTDGSSINGTDMTLNQEQISVPAGSFNAFKAISNTVKRDAATGKRQDIETTWLAPEIGPIRSNLESSSDKASLKFILEMTDTNIPYKKQ